MRTIFFLASSVALRMASGTSRALPWPKPTRPRWSPTTTRAAKPKRRPPFTTLATRLMWTSLSTNSLSRSSPRSRSLSRSRRRPCSAMSVRPFLDMGRPRVSARSEFQPALAGGVGQRLDAAMIDIGAAVEHDLLDARGLCALRHELSHLGGRRGVGSGLQLRAEILVQRRGRRDRMAALVVDDLRVDVRGGAEHGKTRAAGSHLLERLAHAHLPPHGTGILGSHGPTYF